MSKLKIYNIIPGKLIDDISVMDKIFELINSVEYDKWIEINEKVYSSDFFKENNELYVAYLDPRGTIKKLYSTFGNEIIKFMKKYIDFQYSDGIDIAICTKTIDNALICNHDAQVFLLKNK